MMPVPKPKPSSNLVVVTGAGISVESGLQTFRGQNGLWEGHRIEDVATPEAWHRNPELVLTFYNERRIALNKATPNPGHLALASLEKQFQVNIITQNVDDLHERAGSTHILHLHGELKKSRSTYRPDMVFDIQGDLLEWGDLCPLGSQLRPHIVWFGEAVPMMDAAIDIILQADMVIVCGTSLQVYPAAGLLTYTQPETPVILIDPDANIPYHIPNLFILKGSAGDILPKLAHEWLTGNDSIA